MIGAGKDISANHLSMLREILNKYIPGVQVWAHGSRVKQAAKAYSDLDLVVFSSPSQSAKVSALREELLESDIPFLVDIMVWDEIPESFRRIVEESYFVIQ